MYPTIQSRHSPTTMMAELAEAASTPDQTIVEPNKHSLHWGPKIKLDTTNVYQALSGKLEDTAVLGQKTTASSASRAHVTTSDIEHQTVPLPPHRLFVPVGVAGGMGPLATLDLQNKLFAAGERAIKKNGKEYSDQDHMGVISLNLGQMIGDRTTYLKSYKGDPGDEKAWREHLLKPVAENPLWGGLEVCKGLKQVGAHFIVFPCNTWHAWFDILAEKVQLPMLHIAEATVLSLNSVKPKLPDDPKVGLIATTGTIDSQLYQKAGERMKERGGPQITWILPPPAMQEKAMDGIYKGVKGGNMDLGTVLLDEVARDLIDKGANAFIEGCTEVDPALHDKQYPKAQVDAATALAETAVEFSMALARLERKLS